MVMVVRGVAVLNRAASGEHAEHAQNGETKRCLHGANSRPAAGKAMGFMPQGNAMDNARIPKNAKPMSFPLKEVAGIGDVEDGEIQPTAGITFLRHLQLGGDAASRWCGEIFHHAHAEISTEDHNQHAMFINFHDEHAVLLALLVNAVEVILMHQVGDRLVGHEGARRERGNRGKIELARLAVAADEEAALVYDQRRGRAGLGQQFAELVLEPLNVFLDKLRERRHVMRKPACPGSQTCAATDA
jgi:hypothetical protein